ncbi:MAG TPA: NAD(P)-dependent glycerol-3-phosphate dehydrogenase [Rhodobacteraceae bacterium]|nr:NAD(P)-dependent glycerol-3-phosphate dehydrogenase [Paracoccaceae bacterium]
MSRIGIVGAGAFGTALAALAARNGHQPLLWSHGEAAAAAINGRHCNEAHLPGVVLDPAIRATTDMAALAASEALLLVTPAQSVRAVVRRLKAAIGPGTPLVICAKGIEHETGLLMDQVLAQEWPGARVAVLSGPGFAAEIAAGLPAAVTLAGPDPDELRRLAAMIATPAFRIYFSADLAGAQIGGAVKNVLAIACGIVDGRRLGQSARAALVSRGFAEMRRLGLAMGAQGETLSGLAGLGDLILTGTSTASRNYSVGRRLGEGGSLDEWCAANRAVAEGVHTAPVLMTLAAKWRVDMPICAAVAAVLAGDLELDAAIHGLLTRPLTREI